MFVNSEKFLVQLFELLYDGSVSRKPLFEPFLGQGVKTPWKVNLNNISLAFLFFILLAPPNLK